MRNPYPELPCGQITSSSGATPGTLNRNLRRPNRLRKTDQQSRRSTEKERARKNQINQGETIGDGGSPEKERLGLVEAEQLPQFVCRSGWERRKRMQKGITPWIGQIAAQRQPEEPELLSSHATQYILQTRSHLLPAPTPSHHHHHHHLLHPPPPRWFLRLTRISVTQNLTLKPPEKDDRAVESNRPAGQPYLNRRDLVTPPAKHREAAEQRAQHPAPSPSKGSDLSRD